MIIGPEHSCCFAFCAFFCWKKNNSNFSPSWPSFSYCLFFSSCFWDTCTWTVNDLPSLSINSNKGLIVDHILSLCSSHSKEINERQADILSSMITFTISMEFVWVVGHWFSCWDVRVWIWIAWLINTHHHHGTTMMESIARTITLHIASICRSCHLHIRACIEHIKKERSPSEIIDLTMKKEAIRHTIYKKSTI